MDSRAVCWKQLRMDNRPLWQTFADAGDGIASALREQPNFVRQVFIALIAVVGAILLHFKLLQWVILTLTIGLVLAAELFNTCLEHTIDLIQPQSHPLARSAKHAGAGAVLVASIAASCVGVLLYGSALWERFRAH